MNTTSSRSNLLVSERSRRPGAAAIPGPRISPLFGVDPAVTEAGIVADAGESVVDLAELLSNPLDERAYIDPVAVLTIAGDEVLAADEVVDLTIRHVRLVDAGEQPHDVEFGQGEIDPLVVVERPVDVEPELEPPTAQYGLLFLTGFGRTDSLVAFGDQTQTLQDDRQAARLVDEIERDRKRTSLNSS